MSKRDLYANFGSKQEMLVACIKSRAERMWLRPDLPVPRTRQMLAATLNAFAAQLVRESSDPAVIATFRLAIAEATRSPEIAQALDSAGRDATRAALAELLANAQADGLIGAGEPVEMATQYLGLLWEGLRSVCCSGWRSGPGRQPPSDAPPRLRQRLWRCTPIPRPDQGRRHAISVEIGSVGWKADHSFSHVGDAFGRFRPSAD